MSEYVIEISQPGYDVNTADIKNMVISSRANQYKIYLKGSHVQLALTEETLSHGLGYTPAFIAVQKYFGSTNFVMAGENFYADDTYIYFRGNIGDIFSYLVFVDIGA